MVAKDEVLWDVMIWWLRVNRTDMLLWWLRMRSLVT